jgi:hypothetical protein
MLSSLLVSHLLFAAALVGIQPQPVTRAIPTPLLGHPGHVFVAGEEVVLTPWPSDTEWQVTDYEDRRVTSTRASGGRLVLGRLPVGFYRLRKPGKDHAVFLAVIDKLCVPTPATSPIALDVAMAWFYPRDRMDAGANLCALAGVNWVRDRLAWSEMEPQPRRFREFSRYDDSARAQAHAGLRVLQVNHSSPAWANPVTKRFPLDLRDAYRFYHQMARRWRGQVQAFEPWNEADISVFGGHTGAEMATLQKASYLGLKAGNPEVIACLNVFASDNRAQLDDLHANEAWPYFDTFNLHHYASLANYSRLYADFRAVSAGRPLWVTECAMPVKWSGDPKVQEPTDTDLRVQSERIAQVFAGSLHEGSAATFYFLLPHYVEGQTQFGVLRGDLTPRPAYVALAAVGRLLADAVPLGRLRCANPSVQAYLFSAKPDGVNREVLVAWSQSGTATLPLPATSQAVFDHLGRARPATASLSLTTAPQFALLPTGSGNRCSLGALATAPARLPGTASPVVLQAVWAEKQVHLRWSAAELSGESQEIPLYVYNFSEAPVRGELQVVAPSGWQARLSATTVAVASQERVELRLVLDGRQALLRPASAIRLLGNFGPAGKPILSVRVLPDTARVGPRASLAIPGADEPSRWQASLSGGGPITIRRKEDGLLIEAEPKGPDRWVYPYMRLPGDGRPPPGSPGLSCTLTLHEGEGKFRAIFEQTNGSSYVADFLRQPGRGESVSALALFQDAVFGAGWSPPDPGGQLIPGQIQSIKIGCNVKTRKVRFTITKLSWLK